MQAVRSWLLTSLLGAAAQQVAAIAVNDTWLHQQTNMMGLHWGSEVPGALPARAAALRGVPAFLAAPPGDVSPADPATPPQASGGVTSWRMFWCLAVTSYLLSMVAAYCFWLWFLEDKEQEGAMEGLPVHAEEEDEEEDEEEEQKCEHKVTRRRQTLMDMDSMARSTSESRRKTAARAGQRMVLYSRWLNDSHSNRLQLGSVALLVIGAMSMSLEVGRLWVMPACLPVHWSIHALELTAMGIGVACAIACLYGPSYYLYLPTWAFMFFTAPALMLPPFHWSCKELEVHCLDEPERYVRAAVTHADCSLQGQTAQQLLMTACLLLPWVAPQQNMMHLMWIWLFGVYMTWTSLYLEMERFFDDSFIMVRLGVLIITVCIAYIKKEQLEAFQIDRYVANLKLEQARDHMGSILVDMLPQHVIEPLMSTGCFAETIGTASILFILIDDFDVKIVRERSAKDTLLFLNHAFTKMDEICAQNSVTKIETVSEEYVCCVGTSPADQEETQKNGHEAIIGRLFQAASDILNKVQRGELKLKMGIHTGPINAGVIGMKLPRYRLFGDTINTSARMMQKSKPGLLQFGEATHVYTEKAGIESTSGGYVEMKGKGKVMTYHFVRGERYGRMDSSEKMSPRTTSSREVDVRRRTRLSLHHIMPTGAGSFMNKLMRIRTTSAAPPPASAVKSEEQFSPGRETSAKAKIDFAAITRRLNQPEDGSVPTRARWFLSEREGFTDELEEKWQTKFHEREFCTNIKPSMDKHSLGLFVVTLAETTYMVRHRAWMQPHDVFGGPARVPVFLACRFMALAVIGSWRYYITIDPNFIFNNPKWSQYMTLGAQCIVALLVFLSYDVLTTHKAHQVVTAEQVDHGLFEAPFEQVFSLIFMIMFFLIIRFQKSMVFYPSLVFIPLTLLISSLMSLRGVRGVYFPEPFGHFLLMILTLSNCVLAYQEEQTSRSDFKARHATKEIRRKIKGILETMMPPLVLKDMQLQSAEGGGHQVHQYDAATIAQSDLCGFTALASTKTPLEVVNLVADLFNRFDRESMKLGIYKVETVGDAYIAGMAEKPLTEKNSPEQVVQFGLRMIKKVQDWAKRQKVDVNCRVGIHHGACIGGIVGTEMLRYHLFGELMQGLEVLESTGLPGRVQVSGRCKAAVEKEWETECIPPHLKFVQRTEPKLCTSKGEEHDYSEVGGVTYLIDPDE